MTVGEKIQAYRKHAGLSQEELGQQLLVSRQTISLWETGQTLPTIDNLVRLREIFGISVDELLFSDPQTPSATPEKPPKRYSLQKVPGNRKWLLAACLLALLQSAVSVAVSLTFLPHSLWGGVYMTLSLLAALAVSATLFAAKRQTARTQCHTFELVVYENRLLLICCEGTDAERTTAFPPHALRDVATQGKCICFRLGQERFSIPCTAVTKDSPLQASASPRKGRFWSWTHVACILLSLLILCGSTSLLLQRITGDPVRTATRVANVDLPTAEAIHITKLRTPEDGIFVYYRAELYFSDAHAQDFEAAMLTDPRWMQDLPAAALATCIPTVDRQQTADYALLYDRESKAHVTQPQAADHHRYILFSYFVKENMLYLAEFRCTHK